MYKIVHNNELVAVCDAPRYVKIKQQSGAYIETTRENATAVAVNGTAIPIDEVTITEVDGGAFSFNEYVHDSTYKKAIASLEDAICEIDSGE